MLPISQVRGRCAFFSILTEFWGNATILAIVTFYCNCVLNDYLTERLQVLWRKPRKIGFREKWKDLHRGALPKQPQRDTSLRVNGPSQTVAAGQFQAVHAMSPFQNRLGLWAQPGWIIMKWSRGYPALITWISCPDHVAVMHWSRDWSCIDQVIDHALITWLSCTAHVADHAMVTQLPCTGHMTDHALIT